MQQECLHEALSGRVFTDEGEVVCGCGTVLEEGMLEESGPGPAYPLQLYHQLEKGGDPKDMKVVNPRLRVYRPQTSDFSNICGRLNMPPSLQHAAWVIYDKLRKKTRHSRAKCALVAIFHTCRESELPISESQIQMAIRMALSVRKVPGLFRSMYEVNEVLQEIGVEHDPDHAPKYYLNLLMSDILPTIRDPADRDRFKMIAMKKFANLGGDYRKRARRAIDYAYVEMGLD